MNLPGRVTALAAATKNINHILSIPIHILTLEYVVMRTVPSLCPSID